MVVGGNNLKNISRRTSLYWSALFWDDSIIITGVVTWVVKRTLFGRYPYGLWPFDWNARAACVRFSYNIRHEGRDETAEQRTRVSRCVKRVVMMIIMKIKTKTRIKLKDNAGILLFRTV